jgi:hypothetical protein
MSSVSTPGTALLPEHPLALARSMRNALLSEATTSYWSHAIVSASSTCQTKLQQRLAARPKLSPPT